MNVIEIAENETCWLVSDTHWAHVNIVDPSYTERGSVFKDLTHMNEGLIERWNSRIKPEDKVFHLGDFAMGPKDQHYKYFDRLNGEKYLIRGNHDSPKTQALFGERVYDQFWLSYKGIIFWLAHIPPAGSYKDHVSGREAKYKRPEPDNQLIPEIVLHGHTHSTKLERRRMSNMLDVGVDGNDYFPWSIDEVIEELSKPLIGKK